MPLDFPTSPTPGQIYSSGERYWTFDGSGWVSSTGNVSGPPGATGATGPMAGDDKQIIFNDEGSPAGTTGINYDKSSNTLIVYGDLDVNQQLNFLGSTGITSFQANSSAVSTTYTLPVADGNTKQALLTDGAGSLYWGNAAAEFVELADTPNNYENYSGYLVQVNSTEDALEFTDSISVEEINLGKSVYSVQSPPPDGEIAQDTVEVYLKSTTIAIDEREISFNLKTETNEEIIIASYRIQE